MLRSQPKVTSVSRHAGLDALLLLPAHLIHRPHCLIRALRAHALPSLLLP